MDIVRLKLELQQSRKKITVPIINTLLFDNFLARAKATKEEIHAMQLEFFTKVADFMDFFFKFHPYVEEGKQCQESMEIIKDMVENIFMF